MSCHVLIPIILKFMVLPEVKQNLLATTSCLALMEPGSMSWGPANPAKVLAKVALTSHPAPGHAMGKGLPGPFFSLSWAEIGVINGDIAKICKMSISNMFNVTFNHVRIRDRMRRRALSWTIETPEGRRMTRRPEHLDIDI